MQKIKIISLILSMLGIVVFWIAGFNGNLKVAEIAFFTAGIFAGIALFAIALQKLRAKHLY
ncbi:MAG: hypothetical protein E7012_04115 [Alphaproteobacteria bacterium]|nr:hypothetical protein [Alphaproteobacteria bacterium]